MNKEIKKSANGAKKAHELQVSLAHSKQECEASQNKSKKLENDKERLKLSIAEKEHRVIIQKEKHARKAQELKKEIEKKMEVVKDLEARLCLQKREYEKEKDEVKKSAEEKDQKLSEMEEMLCLEQKEHEKLREEYGKKVQELQTSWARSMQEYEALQWLQNKSKKLEKDKEDMNLSIAEKEESLKTQRLEHEKRIQEMNDEIEKNVNVAKFLKARLCQQKSEYEKRGKRTKREFKSWRCGWPAANKNGKLFKRSP